jgi:hypothetical protein
MKERFCLGFALSCIYKEIETMGVQGEKWEAWEKVELVEGKEIFPT